MMLPLILLVIGTTILIMALRSLRAHRLKERYVLLFIFLGLPFVALGIWPQALGQLANWLGIQYQTVVLIGVTTFFLLMIFKLLSIVSMQDRRISTLAQIVAVMSQEKGAAPDWMRDAGQGAV